MSELVITYCDFCNKSQSNNSDGRGYSYHCEETTIHEFDWKRMPDGKVMCVECQDEVVVRRDPLASE